MKRQQLQRSMDLGTQLQALTQKLKLLPAPSPRFPKGKAPLKAQALASCIDHTLLRPEATLDQVLAVCEEARIHGFASVCVHSHWLPEVARALRGSKTLPIAVVGFPHGSMLAEAKAAEARLAVKAGAREIDMVINLGRLKSRDWQSVFQDIRGVVQAAGKAPVKVILETCLLTDEEKVAASALCELAGAAFVKTSTGYSSGGATLEDISLIKKVVGPKMKIKASGGVRTRAFAEALLAAGADRLGASSSVSIMSAESPTISTGSY